jgi:hypothetical protein
VREKRVRKRDTADGGVGSRTASNCRSAGTVAIERACTGGVGVGVGVKEGEITGEADLVGVEDLAFSVIGRATSGEEVLGVEVAAGDDDRSGVLLSAAGAVAFRPKNDSKPPAFLPLLLSFTGEDGSAFFSTMRQPGGASSWTTSGFDLIVASQTVEPLEAKNIDMGLELTRGECLVARKASAMLFATDVLLNGVGSGNVKFSGINRDAAASLS